MHEVLKKKVLKEMLACDICKKLVAFSMEQPLRCPGLSLNEDGKYVTYNGTLWEDIVEKHKLECKKSYEEYKAQHKDHISFHFSDMMRDLYKGNVSITDVVHPQCPRCGGKLIHTEEHIKEAKALSFPESMVGKSYIFTGDKCDHCEERISGTYTPVN